MFVALRLYTCFIDLESPHLPLPLPNSSSVKSSRKCLISSGQYFVVELQLPYQEDGDNGLSLPRLLSSMETCVTM
jgi:hypothetical protein